MNLLPPINYFVYVPLVGRFMPLVGGIRRPVESALHVDTATPLLQRRLEWWVKVLVIGSHLQPTHMFSLGEKTNSITKISVSPPDIEDKSTVVQVQNTMFSLRSSNQNNILKYTYLLIHLFLKELN